MNGQELPASGQPYRAMLLVFSLLMESAGAQGQALPCLDRMVLTGEPEAVSEARDLLTRGLASEMNGGLCEGVELEVAQDGRRWRFRLSKANQTVEHAVGDPSLMVSWVESWIAPDAVPVSAREPPAQESVLPPRSRPSDPIEGPHPAADEHSPLGPPIQLALRGLGDVDDLGGTWAGAELALRVGLSSDVWLGIAAAGAWTPEVNGTERRVMRLSARMGAVDAFEWGDLSFGGGLGMAAGDARYQEAQLEPIKDHSAAPFGEALFGLDVRLNGALGLSVAALLRAHIPDDTLDGDNATDEPWAPEPLPIFALSLELGLSWDLVEGAAP